MPQDGLFFRVLRRFNILWVAIAGLVIIAISGYQLCTNAQFRHNLMPNLKSESLPPPAPVAKELSIVSDNFGSADTQYGPWDGQVLVATRDTPFPDPSEPDAFKNYTPSQAVNVMVFDNKSGKGAWIFPDNNQVITSRDAVYEGAAKANTAPGTDPRPVVGMVMIVTAADKAAKAKSADKLSVYLWTKGAPTAVKLLAADGLQSLGQSGADRYVVVYQKGKETRAAVYSVPEFKKLSDNSLPEAPK